MTTRVRLGELVAVRLVALFLLSPFFNFIGITRYKLFPSRPPDLKFLAKQGIKNETERSRTLAAGFLAMSVEDAVVRLKQLVTTHPELQGVALNLLSVQHKAAVDRLLQEPLASITQALKSASALVFWMHSNGMPPTQEATTRMLDSAGAVVRSAGRERWQAAAAAAAAAEAASTAAVKGVEELLSKARKELRAAEERATTAEERARSCSMDLLQHEVAVMVVEARFEAAE